MVMASLVMLGLGACDALLDEDVTDFGKGPIVVQFHNKTVTNNFLQDGSDAVYEYEVPIEYQGANGEPLSEPVTVTIGVSSASTATEGVEFSLGETEFTIPAGQKTASAVIQVNSANLDAADPKTVVLDITSSSQTVSDKNSTAITLQAICPSDLGGSYTYTNGKAATLTSTGPGTYEVSGDNAFVSNYPIYISDVCGNITVTGGYLEDNFGIPVSGTGTVDYENDQITIVYTVDGYFADRVMVLVKD